MLNGDCFLGVAIDFRVRLVHQLRVSLVGMQVVRLVMTLRPPIKTLVFPALAQSENRPINVTNLIRNTIQEYGSAGQSFSICDL